MSSILPLRLILMAAMAPALTTEASTDKIASATSPVSPAAGGRGLLTASHLSNSEVRLTNGDTRALNGNYCHTNGDHQLMDPHLSPTQPEPTTTIVAKKHIEIGQGDTAGKHMCNITAQVNGTARAKTHSAATSTARESVTSSNPPTIINPVTTPDEPNKMTASAKQNSPIAPAAAEQKVSSDTESVHSSDTNGLIERVKTHPVSPSTSVNDSKKTKILELSADASRKQLLLERRTQRLLQRLRHLQCVHTSTHVRQQLAGFIDSQRRNLQTMAKAMKPMTTDLTPESLPQTEDLKTLSTSALVNLVRQLQYSQVTLRQRLSSSGGETQSVLTLDENLCAEMDRVSGTLDMNLSHLVDEYDSDVTDDSSGGESADELETDKCCTPLARRADWKWSFERGAVASRWTWLQAQVSDLEYRIRQQTDIARQIRAAKGPVVLGDPPPLEDLLARSKITTNTSPASKSSKKLSPIEQKIANIEKRNDMSPCNVSSLLSNVDKQSSRLTQSLGNCYSPMGSPQNARKPVEYTPPRMVNGLIDGLHGNAPGDNAATTEGERATINASPIIDTTCQAARCRPVKNYRKRKLLRMSGVHLLNRKAARLSTIRCHCIETGSLCALCGGRTNNVHQTVDQYSQSVRERVALLDHSYHAILSFKQEMPVTVHFESLLRTGDWQHKSTSKPSQAKTPSSAKRRLKSDLESAKKHKKLTKGGLILSSRYKKGLSKSYSSSLPGTPRNAVNTGRICKTEIKKRKAKKLAIAALKKHQRSLSDPNRFLSTPSPGLDPLGHSCPSGVYRDMRDNVRRRPVVQSAYDIDNIVIPYSMASSTRVEKLNYKEIVTPRWRTLTSENVDQPESQVEEKTEVEEVKEQAEEKSEPFEGDDDDESEDATDETFTLRHERSEILEKKRFLQFMKINKRQSNRASRESGSLTPDPFSKSTQSLPSRTPRDSNAATPEPSQVTQSRTSLEMSEPLSPDSSMTDSLFNSLNLQSPTTPSPLTKEAPDAIRRRSGSLSLSRNRTQSENSQSLATPLPQNPGAPSKMEYIKSDLPAWEARHFPLNNDNYDVLFMEPRPQTPVRVPMAAVHERIQTHPPTAASSSPGGYSTGSTCSGVGEDPDDPEWTVIDEDEQAPVPDVGQKIVLKLAKK